MTKRCTATTETACAPCKEEFFSPEHNHNFCRSCTVCDVMKGSREVKKCEKTSDRICTCVPGYMPADKNARRFACSPCPEGFYSTGGNESCRPWTNCSVLGKETLRAGTKSEDAICSSEGTQPAPSRSVTSALQLSTTHHRSKMLTAMLSSSKPSVVPFVVCPDKNTDTNWGSLSLILICLILLVVSGMSILLLIIQAAKKDTKRRPCRNNQQGPNFRLPIQEEQVDSNSSLIKN
ncbi:PREDICTED: tumor necrosis factor receptor superfamily member 4 [Tinamus guttatus]|uniref:tumor necrosis factor receptor superfamily member 4 n=1 Tax=Tinamus guttatus TaxID=94827 RepID=UPI00052EE353|nr:PREDICTED: tumor necrosis factor receptor superfamily member 4 [Tinamus guttatus]